jgi:hypothetical protein
MSSVVSCNNLRMILKTYLSFLPWTAVKFCLRNSMASVFVSCDRFGVIFWDSGVIAYGEICEVRSGEALFRWLAG